MSFSGGDALLLSWLVRDRNLTIAGCHERTVLAVEEGFPPVHLANAVGVHLICGLVRRLDWLDGRLQTIVLCDRRDQQRLSLWS